MEESSESGINTADGADVDTRAEGPPRTTRRAFLNAVGRKAVYATPVLLTLTATPAMATGHAASCSPAGSPCSVDHDCCSDNCLGNNTCS
ncbi:MAG: hypothetical protein GY842_10955 [bacterium]|nr:hypothetical protein [bacterium]